MGPARGRAPRDGGGAAMTGPVVVVPAHDEEAVIGRALDALRDGSLAQIVVVANGCRDRTAQIAREAGRAVTVIELPVGSKIAALNAGLRAARGAPVAVVDADVMVSGRTLRALAQRMAAAGAGVAAPRLEVIPSRSWWVRQYDRIWALTDYRSADHVGSGVYMLSERGLRRLGSFPDLIADDLYVRQLFAPHERLSARDLVFRVRAPATLAAVVRRNTRIAAGNRELALRFPGLAAPGGGAGARALLRRVWRRPALWPGFLVYAGVYVIAHRRAAALLRGRRPIAWSRDESTRVVTG